MQEVARAFLGFAGVALLFLIVIFAFIRTSNWNEMRDFLDIIVPVIGTLLGAIAGFYFAERRR
jgi:hypothetical protein